MHAGSPPPWERGRSCATRASAQTPPRTGPPARGSRECEGDGRLLLNRFLSCPNFLRRAYFHNKKKRGCVLRAEARGAACRRTVSVCAMSRARGASFRCPEPQAQHGPGDSAGIARSGCRASTEDSGPRACGPGLCHAAAPRRSARRPRGGDPRCRPRQEDEEPGRARCAAHGGLATADAGCPRAPNARAGPPQLQPRTPAEGPALSPHP